MKRENKPPTTLMVIATGAGALLALAILAMSVGPIRGESAARHEHSTSLSPTRS